MSDYDNQDTLLKPRIDMNLAPIVNHSLQEWNARFTELTEEADLLNRNVFALTGIYRSINGMEYRARFDSSTCDVTDHLEISQECDIDSVIGMVMADFPIRPNATFEYFMLPNIKHTLNSSLHIPGIKVWNQEEEEVLQYHQIPNCRFANIGRALVRIFFPALRTELAQAVNSCYVAGTWLETFYNHAVLPAAMEVIPEVHRRTWPANYASEVYRATSTSQIQLQQTSRDFPGRYTNLWLNAIREKIAEHPEISWARGFFLMVEIKGVKHRSSHPAPREELVNEDGELLDPDNPRTLAMRHVLNDFICDEFVENEWYLDIATTVSISDDGHPLSALVNRNAHAEIIKYFTDKRIEQCQRWVDSPSGSGGIYQVDEVAHLGDVAGFRLDLSKSSPSEYGVYYLQVYSTEKSVTYHLDGVQRAKRSSAFRVINDWKKERQEHFIPLQNAFIDAAHTHDVAVRFESRVEYTGYPLVHTEIPELYLRNWLFQLNNSVFWGFKKNRLMAIHHTLNTLHNSRALVSSGKLTPVASLIVLLVYMANALVNRPDEGGNWDEVRDSGCVHIERNQQVVPYRPLVIYNLHSIYYAVKVPRISSHRTISKATLCYLCAPGDPFTESELLDRIRGPPPSKAIGKSTTWNAGDEVVLPTVQFAPSNNRQRKVNIRLETEGPDVLSAVIPDDRNHEDVCTSEEEDPEEQERPMSISQQISNILHNYAVQIFSKAPNNKQRKISWCTLDSVQKAELTPDIFRDKSRLPDIFISYTLYAYDPSKWTRTVSCYFPTPEEYLELQQKGRKIQGLAQLGVWQEWGNVLRAKSKADGTKLATAARSYVNTNWQWLPAVAKNHLWATGNGPGQNAQIGPLPGGPWIVYNPRFR